MSLSSIFRSGERPAYNNFIIIADGFSPVTITFSDMLQKSAVVLNGIEIKKHITDK